MHVFNATFNASLFLPPSVPPACDCPHPASALLGAWRWADCEDLFNCSVVEGSLIRPGCNRDVPTPVQLSLFRLVPETVMEMFSACWFQLK